MKTLTTLLAIFLCINTFAQDKIIKKSGDTINCKVTELLSTEVKYYYVDNPKLVFGIDNALVERVEFGTGEIVNIEENTFNNSEYYAKQNKNALKLNFLSPLFGSTEIVYERSIKPGKSWETALGLVGLGNDIEDNDPRGIYGKFAYKFMKSPEYYSHKMHYSHILKGAYFAPEIALRYVKYDSYYYYSTYYSSYYSPYGYGGHYGGYTGYNTYGYGSGYGYPTYSYNYDSSGSTEIKRESQLTLAIMLKFGKQWIFDDSFLLDIYWGVGYGIGVDENETLPYGFIVAPDDFPIALTSGIRIGWVFGQ